MDIHNIILLTNVPLDIDKRIMYFHLCHEKHHNLALVVESTHLSQGNFPGVNIVGKDNPPAHLKVTNKLTCIDSLEKKYNSHFYQGTFKCISHDSAALLEVSTQEEEIISLWDCGDFAIYLTTEFCLSTWICLIQNSVSPILLRKSTLKIPIKMTSNKKR